MALTKYNYNSFNVTPVASKALAFNSGANGLTTSTEGAMVLIKTITASSDATISFVNGTSDVVLDSTYPIYLFKFINIHPSGAGSEFQVGFRDGGSAYDATKTTTVFYAYHMEDDSATPFTYNTSEDLAQSTAFQDITTSAQIGTDNDESASGEMYLFNPSSTTFVKHFTSRCHSYNSNDYTNDMFIAG